MIDHEKFFTEFAFCMFDAVAKIDPYEEKVYVGRFKSIPEYGDKEYTFDQVIEYLKRRIVIDSNNVCLVTVEHLKKLLEKGMGRKRFRFSAFSKPNIAKKYDLFLSTDEEKGVIFGTIKACTVYENTITFMTKKTAASFNISDIVYVGYGNHCVEIHTENGQSNMFNISFNDAADTLLDHDCFVRSYKNCIVNMDNVVGIADDAFMMNNGAMLSIPKRRLKEIRNIYNEYKIICSDK